MIVEYGRDYLSYIQRWDDHTKATKYTEFSYWELSKYLDFNNSHVSDHYPDYLDNLSFSFVRLRPLFFRNFDCPPSVSVLEVDRVEDNLLSAVLHRPRTAIPVPRPLDPIVSFICLKETNISRLETRVQVPKPVSVFFFSMEL